MLQPRCLSSDWGALVVRPKFGHRLLLLRNQPLHLSHSSAESRNFLQVHIHICVVTFNRAS